MKTLTTIAWLCVLACLQSTAQSISGVVNTYYAVSSINTGSNSLIVDNGNTLSAGELVLLIQTKGATVDATNAATFGNITALGSAGAYEFNVVCQVSGNQVWLKAPFMNTYDATGNLQLVGVPSYSSVTVSGTINATAWDPATGKGGIVAIQATNTILLNADIDVSGAGFQGGYLVNYPTPAYNCSAGTMVNQYFLGTPASGNVTAGRKGEGIAAYITNEENARGKLANGGGGGNNANSGGAGGGNYGTGGNGGTRSGESLFNCHGQYPGIGGSTLSIYGYSAADNRIFFGGGGGAGHENNGVGEPGGNGGGIIILSAPTITGGGGQLLANGAVPTNPACSTPTVAEGDGGGGGGAGGTIILNTTTINGSTIVTQATGANGSNSSDGVNDCTGPGGGGGGGIVWTSGASVPATISATVTGGANGIVSLTSSSTAGCKGTADGATSGGAGTSKASYVLPMGSGSTCVVLASPLVGSFTGEAMDQGSQLSWELITTASSSGVKDFVLERSVDQLHYTVAASVPASDALTYNYIDPATLSGTAYYRMSWTDGNGVHFYSRVVVITHPMGLSDGTLHLFPNPASDRLTIGISASENRQVAIKLFNAQGQQLGVYAYTLHSGANSFTVPVQALAAGTYFVVVEANGQRLVQSFLRRNK